jgi:RNA polymerase sigma-70 factor (ECF subfamily)
MSSSEESGGRPARSSAAEDAAVLERIRGGEPEAYAEIIQRHQSRIFSILYRYERDAQRLEDLAQETFIKAWRALEQFDSRAPFEHWLSKIAVRTALDHLRRERKHKQEIGLPELGEDVLDWLRTGDEKSELDSRNAAEILRLAMHDLSPTDQIIITMQELEGRSVKEIAALLSISGVAVRVRALRARSKLKSALQKLEESDSHE